MAELVILSEQLHERVVQDERFPPATLAYLPTGLLPRLMGFFNSHAVHFLIE